MGRARCESLLAQNNGDLAIDRPQSVQLDDTLTQTVLIGVLGVALHCPLQPVFTDGAGLPDHPDPHMASPALLIERDFLDDQANDLFALCRGGGRGVPQPRQVFPERQYRSAVVLRDRGRLLATPRIVIVLDLVDAPQPFFPDPLE